MPRPRLCRLRKEAYTYFPCLIFGRHTFPQTIFAYFSETLDMSGPEFVLPDKIFGISISFLKIRLSFVSNTPPFRTLKYVREGSAREYCAYSNIPLFRTHKYVGEGGARKYCAYQKFFRFSFLTPMPVLVLAGSERNL